MNRMIASLLLGAALCLGPAAAFAAPPTPEQVDRLLTVMRAKDTVAAMLPQIEASQRQMVQQLTAGQELSADQRAQLDRTLQQSSAAVTRALSWEKLEPLYRTLYSQTFEGSEIDAMADFYSTPAGQSMLDKMPLLMQNTMQAVQSLIVPMLQELERDIRNAAAAEADAEAKAKK